MATPLPAGFDKDSSIAELKAMAIAAGYSTNSSASANQLIRANLNVFPGDLVGDWTDYETRINDWINAEVIRLQAAWTAKVISLAIRNQLVARAWGYFYIWYTWGLIGQAA